MSDSLERGEIEIEGVRRSALIFRLTLDGMRAKRLGQAIWLVPLLVFAVVYVILLIRIGTRTDVVGHILRIFVLSMEVVFIGVAIWLVRGWRKPGYVALLREGIYSRSSLGWLLVPWETISNTGTHKFGGLESLGVRTRVPPRIGSRLVKVTRRLNRGFTGWDFAYPLLVISGGADFRRIVESCVADPAERTKVI